MKKGKDEALRWLKQAEYNLRVAENNLKSDFYSAACFMSEQSAQVALKAYIISKTHRPVLWIHSIQKLSEKCAEYDKDFERLIEYGRILDRFYIPTRYPDAITPPALPYETYTKKDAKEAVRFSKNIISKVKKRLLEEKK